MSQTWHSVTRPRLAIRVLFGRILDSQNVERSGRGVMVSALDYYAGGVGLVSTAGDLIVTPREAVANQ